MKHSIILIGFETSSTTLSFCMYELAKNREIQEKVHEEIDSILAKHGGQITYEAVAEMTYLENCIDGIPNDILHFKIQ